MHHSQKRIDWASEDFVQKMGEGQLFLHVGKDLSVSAAWMMLIVSTKLNFSTF